MITVCINASIVAVFAVHYHNHYHSYHCYNGILSVDAGAVEGVWASPKTVCQMLEYCVLGRVLKFHDFSLRCQCVSKRPLGSEGLTKMVGKGSES